MHQFFGVTSVPSSLCTWINNGILFTEGNSGIFSFPLGSLDFQVAFLDGQEGDALVVSRVELCQVLKCYKHQPT